MEVLSLKEQPDGSAILELELTEEEDRLLVEYAVVNILMDKIAKENTDE